MLPVGCLPVMIGIITFINSVKRPQLPIYVLLFVKVMTPFRTSRSPHCADCTCATSTKPVADIPYIILNRFMTGSLMAY